jgi:hypothetical protein
MCGRCLHAAVAKAVIAVDSIVCIDRRNHLQIRVSMGMRAMRAVFCRIVC